jgi:hypothetical protein
MNIPTNLTEYECDSRHGNRRCALFESDFTALSCVEEPAVTASKFVAVTEDFACVTETM